MYKLVLRRKVRKQLNKIPTPYAKRLAEAIRNLAKNPKPQQAKSLRNNLYRVRVGPYRIIYAIFDEQKTIAVMHVARRSENTYRDLAQLIAAAKRLVKD